MNNVAKCYIEGKRINIEPISVMNDEDFSEELLAELIPRGLHGKELLDAFFTSTKWNEKNRKLI